MVLGIYTANLAIMQPYEAFRKLFFVCVSLRPNAGYGFLIHEVSRSHTTTHHGR